MNVKMGTPTDRCGSHRNPTFMHAVLRALLSALGMAVACGLCAQTEPLPPIFAPRTRASPPPRPSTFVRSSVVSDRVRELVQAAAAHLLEEAKPFDGPTSAGGKLTIDTTTGALVMAPLVVRGQALKDSQVRPPEIQLYRFTPLMGDKHRRVAGGAVMPVYHAFLGDKEFQVDLSLLNLAGKGIDHNIDFSRVEIGFTLKW